MKRNGLRLLGLLLALALILGGCTPGRAVTPPEEQPTERDYVREYGDRWCYRCLTPRMQQMYAALYRAVKEYRTDTWVTIREGNTGTEYVGLKVKLPTPLTDSDEARLLFTAFTADNPEFFYIGNTYSYEGYRQGGVDRYDVFCLTLTMDARSRDLAAAELERAVAGILAQTADCADEYRRELRIHDLLAARITYDAATAEGDPAEQRANAFTAYGALVEGSAVCEGYSRAMQLLMNRLGIRCTLVSGSAPEGGSHMWNLLEIDGRGYHLDLTWDDGDDRLHHTFFNLTTEEILLSHRIDGDNVGVDTCVSTGANYYRREGLYLTTYDREEIASAVAARIKAGAETVDLRFSEETFANAQLFFSSSRRLTQYVERFLEGEKMWRYTCQANETYHTLTLYKEN